ncbi:hypothetical protein Q6A65_00525 [Helicobacter pylori]|uniref:hypothetical protein n=1 Tax=Helicobacter pylori TaxID=210 RepID=UPI002711ECC5|nr:hypothetical protein [Helicobacter pylori]MDO7811164.1 hypothetical protein [Helicobacter pylori]WQU26959.1 hypothetical protein KVC16_07195 [Helicobacter pylori]
METKEEDKDKKLEEMIVLLCERGICLAKQIKSSKISKKSMKENTGINTQKLPKTNALKPLAFSYGDTRRNAFRRANME